MNAAMRSIADGAVVAKRNLIKIKRVPDLLVFTTLSPIMFVLLFAYVFGSAIKVPGVNYREFLIAGIFAQTVIFGATITGAGLADDIPQGVIDRFRSLPMSRSAVLVGRTASDVVNNVIVIIVMSLTGLLVGWRIRTSPLEALGGFLLLLLFAYAISWIMACVGKGAVRQHQPEHTTAGRLAAPASRRLHAVVGHCDPGRLRAPGGAAVQAGGPPLRRWGADLSAFARRLSGGSRLRRRDLEGWLADRRTKEGR